MLEPALFRHDRVPGDALDVRRHRVALEVGDRHTISREDCHLAVAQKEDVARVVKNRRYIGSDEVFVLAESYDHGRSLSHGNNLIPLVRRHDREGKYAPKVSDGAPASPLQDSSCGLRSGTSRSGEQ